MAIMTSPADSLQVEAAERLARRLHIVSAEEDARPEAIPSPRNPDRVSRGGPPYTKPVSP
jgi:hypothetical protein